MLRRRLGADGSASWPTSGMSSTYGLPALSMNGVAGEASVDAQSVARAKDGELGFPRTFDPVPGPSRSVGILSP